MHKMLMICRFKMLLILKYIFPYESGKTVSQVAIRWLLQSPPVTSVIVGTTKVHQLEDNMGAAGWRLTDEEVRTGVIPQIDLFYS